MTRDAEIHRLVKQACVSNERSLRVFLNAVLRDSHLAEDAFQRTVAKAIESASATNAGSLRGWLFRIALNTARDFQRDIAKEQRNRRAVHEMSAGRPSAAASDSVADLITEEERTLVRKALSRLREEHRNVVVRRIQHGQTFTEIAEELDRPVGTILTWMRRALIELKQMNEIRDLSDDGTHG